MARPSLRPWYALVLALGLVVAGFAWHTPAPAAESQILTISSQSLTSYEVGVKTLVQGVQPRVEQRGVGIDGALRARAPHGMGIAGNPFGAVWNGTQTHNGVRLDTGSFSPWESDIALASPGFSWTVGRSYSAVQEATGGRFDSDGPSGGTSPQGVNWFQISQPEILLHDDPAGADKDFIYLVYGADRYLEYQRYDADSTEFRGRNGAAGVFLYELETEEDEPDTYTLTDQRGTQYVFFGFDIDADLAAGQLWKITDADGNTAYVGDDTTKSDAITGGYDDYGRIEIVYDTASRRFTYDYDPTTTRLNEVKAETKTGGTWASPTGLKTAAEVDYSYYTDETHGDAGALKLVTITTPLSDSDVSSTRRKYYRYWEGTYDLSTNPGYPYTIKYVLDWEGTRNYDYAGDSSFNQSYTSASDSSIQAYASEYFEYDSNHKVAEAWFNGACGCSGAAAGTHEYEYETNGSYTDGTGYDAAWARRTVVKLPNGSYLTQYYDEVGQGLHRVTTDADPDNTSPVPSKWVTSVVRDSSGRVTNVHTPANITGYTHSTGTITTSTSAGLAMVFTYLSSGDMTGYLEHRKHEKGTSGSEYLLETLTYTSFTKTIDTDLAVARPLVASRRAYPTAIISGVDDSVVTTFDYSSYLPDAGKLMAETVTTTYNAVSTDNKGSGSSTTSSRHLNEDGLVDFTKSRGGSITYRKYVQSRLVMLIEDADTSLADPTEDFYNITIPSGFSSSGSPLHRKTEYDYDYSGAVTVTLPGERVTKVYRSRLADERLIVLNYPKVVAGSPTTYHGPVRYTVTNHAGKLEAQGLIDLGTASTTLSMTSHVDETKADVITAVENLNLGDVCRLTTNQYDEPGTTLASTFLYHDLGSFPGAEGTNYDTTTFAYDDSGHTIRIVEPSGTIRRTTYDDLGRVATHSIGTNDTGLAGSDMSGTENMVTTEFLEYDDGNDDGNGYLTERARYIQDSATEERVTSFEHDLLGNVLLQTNPTAPHAFYKYDNLSRRIASGLFSSTTNIVVGSDDPTTETSNRLALSQSYYDELGRVWKTTTHKIDDADGSNDDNLESLSWRDADGRTIKTDGDQLAKTVYDGLGRVTHAFVLAVDNDTGYADADDVTGDIVLVEHQTTYDPSNGNVIMAASIDRYHSDKGGSETTGPLDTNGDGETLEYDLDPDVKGRIQITGMWYDALDRLTDTVEFGNNGGSDFVRDPESSPPARSASALRTAYGYATDGMTDRVTDPLAHVHLTEYDNAGRVVKEVRNYDANVNTGLPDNTDDNVTVKYEYTKGLRTKLIADLEGTNDDQETVYNYGTTKGVSAGDSLIATKHLLQRVRYPDYDSQANPADEVTFAYNAQGQQIYRKDQAGNVIVTDYDDSGRITQQRVTTKASGFDGDVLRIASVYDNLGRLDTVTQYDDAAVGSGTIQDEVAFTYDDWGNLSLFEEDRNSAVSTGNDEYTVSYAWEKATTGRNTLRLSSMDLPSGATIDYIYSSTDSSHDDDVSRVSYLEHDDTIVSTYDYNGLGQVVGTKYDEIAVMWNLYGSVGQYPDLDAFNRVTSSRWTKDLASDVDFYDIDITYDWNSNITVIEDNVHVDSSSDGLFDVSYSIDDLDRLTQAEEGTWGGSSITTTYRDEQWTLDHVGNWDVYKLDLDGDGNWGGTGELNDDRTHNDVNELTARDTDDNGTDNYALTYDATGNLTNDTGFYAYEYDAFYRLRKIKEVGVGDLVAEYRYNGLGHRIAEHVDTDASGEVDGDDDWRYFAHDEQWRTVAHFIEDDTTPIEEFLHHAAGLDGMGGSSYIDSIVLRERDSTEDETMDERLYYCQNWRADVSAIVDDSGVMQEWVKYSSYGVPFGLPAADTESDGDCDSTDGSQILTWARDQEYDVRGDVNLDGSVTVADKTLQSGFDGTTLGRWKLSAIDNLRGYAGYDLAQNVKLYHVRHRVLSPELGRWLRRDPLGYVDSLSLYEYALSQPTKWHDPTGTEVDCDDWMSIPSMPDGFWTVCEDHFGPPPSGCGWYLDPPCRSAAMADRSRALDSAFAEACTDLKETPRTVSTKEEQERDYAQEWYDAKSIEIAEMDIGMRSGFQLAMRLSMAQDVAELQGFQDKLTQKGQGIVDDYNQRRTEIDCSSLEALSRCCVLVCWEWNSSAVFLGPTLAHPGGTVPSVFGR